MVITISVSGTGFYGPQMKFRKGNVFTCLSPEGHACIEGGCA